MEPINTISAFAKGDHVTWTDPKSSALYGHTFEITDVNHDGDVYLVGVDIDRKGWLWKDGIRKIERINYFQEENNELDSLFDGLDRTEESA